MNLRVFKMGVANVVLFNRAVKNGSQCGRR